MDRLTALAKAMKNYHDKTCIRFIPRTSERGYINIMKGSGCSSSVGRTGRMQQVSTVQYSTVRYSTAAWAGPAGCSRSAHTSNYGSKEETEGHTDTAFNSR